MARQREITGKHVLWGLIAFFGVMFLANGAFVYFAVSSFTGLATENAYRKGLAYNERVAAAERQAASGWRARVDLAPGGDALSLALTDRSGLPVTGLRISAVLGRPATDRFDRALTLRERKPGRYATHLANALSPGQWILRIEAARLPPDASAPDGGGKVVYRLKRRIWLKAVQ